jgi:PAS domain S-box-containing protein
MESDWVEQVFFKSLLRMKFFRTFLFLLIGTRLLASDVSNIDVKTRLFVDKSKSIDVTEIADLYDQFRKVTPEKMSLKPFSGTAWIAVEIKNKNSAKKQLVLEVENNLISAVFYNLDSILADRYRIGNQIENYSKHSAAHIFYIEPGQDVAFLIKIETNDFPLVLPIHVRELEDFDKHRYTNIIATGLFFGFIALVFLISSTMGIVSRRKSPILFACFIFFTTPPFVFLEGSPFMFLKYISLDQLVVMAKSSIPVAMAFLGLYLNNFFRIKNFNKKTYKIFEYGGWSFFFLAAVNILFHNYASSLYVASYVVIALGILFLINILTYAKAKKVEHVTPIIISLIIFIVSLLIKFFIDFCIIPPSPFAIHSLKIGFAILIIGVVISISFRFRDQLDKLKELNFQLDIIVKKRTADINTQNEELRRQAEELRSQGEELEVQNEELAAQTDELTEQKELLQKQNIHLERLQLALSQTDNAIYIFDAEGTLLWFNTSSTSQLGMEYEEYVNGNDRVKIYNTSYCRNIGNNLDKCLFSKSKVTYEFERKDIHGRELNFQTTLTPVIQNDEIKYIVAIDTDITQIKQYELEIELQRHLATTRKNELEAQQAEMLESLRYALRIQNAILPQSNDVKRFFPESFVIFEPKDIVSGDFYWFHRIKNKFVFVAVDCTGHGVPGAFMSIVGYCLLNNIIIQNGVTSPADILKQLNRKLKIALKNENPTRQTDDGMDVSLVVLDITSKKLTFAGAFRPLFLRTQNDFVEIKGDKIPITSRISGNVMAQFKEWEFDVEKGDRFYIFTDGITDQFGGKDDKKFLVKRFKQLILDSQSLSMDKQKDIIKQANIEWRGGNPQVDDILVIGVQI